LDQEDKKNIDLALRRCHEFQERWRESQKKEQSDTIDMFVTALRYFRRSINSLPFVVERTTALDDIPKLNNLKKALISQEESIAGDKLWNLFLSNLLQELYRESKSNDGQLYSIMLNIQNSDKITESLAIKRWRRFLIGWNEGLITIGSQFGKLDQFHHKIVRAIMDFKNDRSAWEPQAARQISHVLCAMDKRVRGHDISRLHYLWQVSAITHCRSNGEPRCNCGCVIQSWSYIANIELDLVRFPKGSGSSPVSENELNNPDQFKLVKSIARETTHKAYRAWGNKLAINGDIRLAYDMDWNDGLPNIFSDIEISPAQFSKSCQMYINSDCFKIWDNLNCPAEYEFRQRLVKFLMNYFKLRGVNLYQTGSHATGLFISYGDLDFVAKYQNDQTRVRNLPMLNEIIYTKLNFPKPYDISLTDLTCSTDDDPTGFESWEFRVNARVPIIRMKLSKLNYKGRDVTDEMIRKHFNEMSDDQFVKEIMVSSRHGTFHRDDMEVLIDGIIDVDIGENWDGVVNSELLGLYSSWNPIVSFSIRILRTLFRSWEVFKTNSYTVTLMALFAIQHHNPPLVPNLHSPLLLQEYLKDIKNVDNESARYAFWKPCNGIWTDEERIRIGKMFGIPQEVLLWATNKGGIQTNHIKNGVWNLEYKWSKRPEFVRAVARYLLTFYVNIFPAKNAVVDIRSPGAFKSAYPFWLIKDICTDHNFNCKCCKVCVELPYITKGRNFELRGSYGLSVIDPIEIGRVIGVGVKEFSYIVNRMFEGLKALDSMKSPDFKSSDVETSS